MPAGTWSYPRVIAHRCGGALAPENTLAGLDVCALAGLRAVEFDVMLSADGTPWVIHDETLERTTTGKGRVCDAADATLDVLDAGLPFHAAFRGEPLPRFMALAARCRELGLIANVEIKPAAGFEAETGRAVALAARDAWRDAAIPPLLSSFSELALRAAAQAARELPRAWLVDEVPADWRERSAALDVIAIHTDCAHLTEATCRAVKAAGLGIAAYTENDPLRARQLLAWGADAVITDRPDRLRDLR